MLPFYLKTPNENRLFISFLVQCTNNKKIYELISDAYRNQISKLIIVTGKGLHSDNEKNPYVSKDLGMLKYSVLEYIRGNNELMGIINEIRDAEIEDGGSGAFYIFLKKIIK